MPTGIYVRKPRVAKVAIHCEVCGQSRLYTPGAAQRRTGRFCSKKCSAAVTIKPGTKAPFTCEQCGSPGTKRRDHMGERNFCSRECFTLSRTKSDAKWRDPAYIRDYMKAYATLHTAQRRIHQKSFRDLNRKALTQRQKIRRSVSPADRGVIGALLRRADGRCVYCAREFTSLEIDHLLAVWNGGKNNRRNLIPCCRSCNGSKGKKDYADWIFEKHGVEGLARTLLFLEKRDAKARAANLYSLRSAA